MQGITQIHGATWSGLCGAFSLIFKIYLSLDRGGGREKEKERNVSVWLLLLCPLLGTWPTTQACAPTGNGTRDPLVHRPALDPLSRPSWGCAGLSFLCLPGMFLFFEW